MSAAKKVDAPLDLGVLRALLDKATQGPWRLSTGMMCDSLWITASEREPSYLDREKHDGPICHVSTEKHHFKTDKDVFGNARGESRSWKTPIKKARADAELIVAAVNALPELLRRLRYDGAETAWLIEWPADKYGPIRYWAAGEPQPVIDANHATRFARRDDAVAALYAYADQSAKAVEHMWINSTKRAEKSA
jgi:hypothetical protein